MSKERRGRVSGIGATIQERITHGNDARTLQRGGMTRQNETRPHGARRAGDTSKEREQHATECELRRHEAEASSLDSSGLASAVVVGTDGSGATNVSGSDGAADIIDSLDVSVNSRQVNPSKQARPQLVLGFETALLFWRAVHEGRLQRPMPTNDIFLPRQCATTLAQIRGIDLTALGVRMTGDGMVSLYSDRTISWDVLKKDGRCADQVRPVPLGIGLYPGMLSAIHVMTGNRLERSGHRAIRAHLVTQRLPPGSLYRISQDIMVVSCEMAFAQCSQDGRSLPQIELALELCGTYGLMTAGLPCRYDCKPVTSVGRLMDYLQDCVRMPGVRLARRSVSWAIDMMASPRESEIYLYVTLPKGMGGFGFDRPSANVVIPVKGTPAENLTHESFYRVDLVWKDKRVVLEYDGIEEHEKDPSKVAADKERRSVLAALGYTVIVMTKRDLKSKDDLRKKMAQLAYALGVELPDFERDEAKAHNALFSWLNNPLHDHLPLGCGYR